MLVVIETLYKNEKIKIHIWGHNKFTIKEEKSKRRHKFRLSRKGWKSGVRRYSGTGGFINVDDAVNLMKKELDNYKIERILVGENE